MITDGFKSDVDQVFETMDVAYEENRALNEDEEKLLKQFNDKYMLGQLQTDDEIYEMSDLEKEITREVDAMSIFTEHDEPLASETTFYEKAKNEVEELLAMKEVPDDLIDKHPTFEEQDGIHPKLLEDAKKMIDNLNPVINERDEIYQDEYDKLHNFIDEYGGDGFQVDGAHYLHNEESLDVYMLFWSISYGLDDGKIAGYDIEEFNELKDNLE